MSFDKYVGEIIILNIGSYEGENISKYIQEEFNNYTQNDTEAEEIYDRYRKEINTKYDLYINNTGSEIEDLRGIVHMAITSKAHDIITGINEREIVVRDYIIQELYEIYS